MVILYYAGLLFLLFLICAVSSSTEFYSYSKVKIIFVIQWYVRYYSANIHIIDTSNKAFILVKSIFKCVIYDY